MRPTYSAEAEAYREKVQAFLAEKLPAKWGGIGSLEGDDITAFVTRMAHDVVHRGLPGSGLADRVRRRRTVGARAGDHRRGVRQGRRADRRSERRVRHPDARQHVAEVGHRRAEEPLPAADPVGRGHVVSGILRAERRQRPLQRRAARRARRRPVGAQRAEDLDIVRPSRRPHLHARSHRSRRTASTRASRSSSSTCVSRGSRFARSR